MTKVEKVLFAIPVLPDVQMYNVTCRGANDGGSHREIDIKNVLDFYFQCCSLEMNGKYHLIREEVMSSSCKVTNFVR
jgi:hypothetical protein